MLPCLDYAIQLPLSECHYPVCVEIYTLREGLKWKARSAWILCGCRTWNGKPGPEFFRGHAQIIITTS